MKGIPYMRSREISTVKDGANGRNKGRPFPIIKGENQMPGMNEIIQAVIETPAEGEAEYIKTLATDLSTEGKDATIATFRILKGFSDKLPKSAVDSIIKAAGGTVAPSEPKPEPKVKPEPTPQADPKPVTDINKALQEINKKHEAQMALMQKSMDTLAATLTQITDATGLDHWVKKAEAELSHVPNQTSVELGQMLYTMEKAKTGSSDPIFQAFKKSSDMIKNSNLLQIAGSGSALVTDGSAEDKIQKSANKLIEKSTNSTDEEAYCKAMEDDPRLYQDYLDEHPEQTGLK